MYVPTHLHIELKSSVFEYSDIELKLLVDKCNEIHFKEFLERKRK